MLYYLHMQEHPLFLAPLAGYTDKAFRQIAHSFGADGSVTEMVSAEGLARDSAKTKALLDRYPGEENLIVQIFAPSEDPVARCLDTLLAFNPSMIDINCGCPVPKVYKNGEGSALLADFPRAAKIISACKRSGKVVSVKFRIGLERGKYLAADFAKLCEDAGADMIAVHGRTRDCMYAGEPVYEQIAAAKAAVSIPVVANGGVFSRADAEKMLRETGADGVMVARAAMYCPHVFAEILGKDIPWDARAAVDGQIADMLPFYGEKFTLVQMRKMAAFYLRGRRGSAEARASLFACNSIDALRAALDNIYGPRA